MSRTPVPGPCVCPRQRAARAQAAIRALLARRRRKPLTAAEQLELAQWQREWVEAWREGQYVIVA